MQKLRNTIKNAMEIASHLSSHGWKAYFTGGAVRDILLDKIPLDIDIVTDAPQKTIRNLFSNGYRAKEVGKTFSICIVNDIEVASCRSHCHNNGSSDTFPESDLEKRDITINSMALDPQDEIFRDSVARGDKISAGTIIDPFSGKKDIKDKIIRFTDNPDSRIREDPLRMIRACRFASYVQGKIESVSLKAIQKNRELLLQEAAPERIHHEILKAMSHPRPSIFFQTLRLADLLEIILPSLDVCFTLDGGPFHGETVFEHCMLVGDALSCKKPILRLAGYLHDTGKYQAACIKDGRLTFPDHEKQRDSMIHDLENLKFSRREICRIDALVSIHMRPLRKDSTPRAVRRLLAMLEQKEISYRDFMRLRIADKAGNLAKHPYTFSDIWLRLNKIQTELKEHKKTAFNIKDLDISGHDIMALLGMPPGPNVGKILEFLLKKVMDDPSLNTFQKLKYLAVKNFTLHSK